MAEDAVAGGTRYRAFISYSHRDARFGRRLHARLEQYLIPRRLVGRATAFGKVPRRLVPIFRDREELSAAGNLSAEVRAALQASQSLVVVCSPAAAASQWVCREVELFRELHPDRPVLAALLAGEPVNSLPAPLRRVSPTGDIIEPLAADFRRNGDGAQLGLLKLVAGILGIGLDELIQRDANRRLQRVMAVTALAVVAMLLMGALTIFAMNARAEAERQRSGAEGLVEFMLTDLRDRLKGVGRLDLMAAPVPSLERRARILHAMGEDDETRGDNDAALAKFEEARRTTAALLADSPNDPERIFAHAQTEFWIGTVDYQRDHIAAAASSFRAYKRLTDRLVQIAPHNPQYRREAGDADVNLCVIAETKPRNPAAAIRYCTSALAETEEAARHLGPASGIMSDVINAHAWLADAYRIAGDLARAKSERLTEERILDAQIAADPKNMDLRDSWVATQRDLAGIEKQSGDAKAARAGLEHARAVLDEMVRFDPRNQRWIANRDRITHDLSELH
jgi:tetratricopeptide (TPR) repeat protein